MKGYLTELRSHINSVNRPPVNEAWWDYFKKLGLAAAATAGSKSADFDLEVTKLKEELFNHYKAWSARALSGRKNETLNLYGFQSWVSSLKPNTQAGAKIFATRAGGITEAWRDAVDEWLVDFEKENKDVDKTKTPMRLDAAKKEIEKLAALFYRFTVTHRAKPKEEARMMDLIDKLAKEKTVNDLEDILASLKKKFGA